MPEGWTPEIMRRGRCPGEEEEEEEEEEEGEGGEEEEEEEERSLNDPLPFPPCPCTCSRVPCHLFVVPCHLPCHLLPTPPGFATTPLPRRGPTTAGPRTNGWERRRREPRRRSILICGMGGKREGDGGERRGTVVVIDSRWGEN